MMMIGLLLFIWICLDMSYNISVRKMGLVLIGASIGAAITKNQIEQLEREINYIISTHEELTNSVIMLSEYLKRFDLTPINDKIQQMDQVLSQNLKIILGDQQQKLNALSKVDPTKIGVDPKATSGYLTDIITLVGNILTIVSLLCATNPVTIAVTAIIYVIESIFSIMKLIGNIKKIEELTKIKKDLEEYYKPGGEFDQQCKMINDLSVQLTENFYVFVVNFRSMIFELDANINLLTHYDNQTGLNYQEYIDLLKKNPFDSALEWDCAQLFNIINHNYKHCSVKTSVNIAAKQMEKFHTKYDIPRKIQIAGQIVEKFDKNSLMGKALQAASASATELANMRNQYQVKFQKRLNKSANSLQSSDVSLFEHMLGTADLSNLKPQCVVEVAAFYTQKFYGDDPTGDTLMKRNLKQVAEQNDTLAYLGANKGMNLTYLPEPKDPVLRAQWMTNKIYLENSYKNKVGHESWKTKNMYMRMETGSYEANGTKTKMDYYYGLTLDITGSLDDFHQVTSSQIFEATMPVPQSKLFYAPPAPYSNTQKMEESNPNLNDLCRYVEFFVNGVAYPERISSFTIAKTGNNYKANVQWLSTEKDLNPAFQGKDLSYTITPINDVKPEDPGTIVYFTQAFADINSKVVFRLK